MERPKAKWTRNAKIFLVFLIPLYAITIFLIPTFIQWLDLHFSYAAHKELLPYKSRIGGNIIWILLMICIVLNFLKFPFKPIYSRSLITVKTLTCYVFYLTGFIAIFLSSII